MPEGALQEVSLKSLKTRPELFQFRETVGGDHVDQQWVDNIAKNFSWEKFDPLVVARDPDNPHAYVVLGGHHRLAALQKYVLASGDTRNIPIRIVDGNLNDPEQAKRLITEAILTNYGRKGTNMKEDARAAYELHRAGHTYKSIQQAMGVRSVNQVHNLLWFAALPMPVQHTAGETKELQGVAIEIGRAVSEHGLKPEEAQQIFSGFVNELHSTGRLPPASEVRERFRLALIAAESAKAQSGDLPGFEDTYSPVMKAWESQLDEVAAIKGRIRTMDYRMAACKKLAEEMGVDVSEVLAAAENRKNTLNEEQQEKIQQVLEEHRQAVLGPPKAPSALEPDNDDGRVADMPEPDGGPSDSSLGGAMFDMGGAQPKVDLRQDEEDEQEPEDKGPTASASLFAGGDNAVPKVPTGGDETEFTPPQGMRREDADEGDGMDDSPGFTDAVGEDAPPSTAVTEDEEPPPNIHQGPSITEAMGDDEATPATGVQEMSVGDEEPPPVASGEADGPSSLAGALGGGDESPPPVAQEGGLQSALGGADDVPPPVYETQEHEGLAASFGGADAAPPSADAEPTSMESAFGGDQLPAGVDEQQRDSESMASVVEDVTGSPSEQVSAPMAAEEPPAVASAPAAASTLPKLDVPTNDKGEAMISKANVRKLEKAAATGNVDTVKEVGMNLYDKVAYRNPAQGNAILLAIASLEHQMTGEPIPEGMQPSPARASRERPERTAPRQRRKQEAKQRTPRHTPPSAPAKPSTAAIQAPESSVTVTVTTSGQAPVQVQESKASDKGTQMAFDWSKDDNYGGERPPKPTARKSGGRRTRPTGTHRLPSGSRSRR